MGMPKKKSEAGLLAKSVPVPLFFSEPQFRMLLARERNRSERTRTPFLLVVTTIEKPLGEPGNRAAAFEKLRECLIRSSREIDVRGWYRDEEAAGVIFTDVKKEGIDGILRKLNENMNEVLGGTFAAQIRLRHALYPLEDGKSWIEDPGALGMIYPGQEDGSPGPSIQQGLKRMLDASASFIALTMLIPLFAVVAAIIKATSPGPVFFRQQRIGFGGKPFTMYKFRSMKTNSDPAIHKAYVEKLIKGGPGLKSENNGNGNKTFKIQNDPRLTLVGDFLRKSSIDELPQLFNVLTGTMSLVGPRPPIRYEVEAYDVWHWRRLIYAKPGITGLWQVEGRSRTTFDEMVRMDIRYSQTWSIWLDIILIMKTPMAVVAGKGAY